MNKTVELTISLVIYRPLLEQLNGTLQSLVKCLDYSKVSFHLYIIDNTPIGEDSGVNEEYLSQFLDYSVYSYFRNEKNVGFGKAHNAALNVDSNYHLVLNPDLILSEETITQAIDFMTNNQNCGLITPHVIWSDGNVQRLCKKYPSVFILLLRGFAPDCIKKIFKKKLEDYEMVKEIGCHSVYLNPPMVSGCFMFFRTSIWKKCQGFDERYFLYFEDFDLSIRVKKFCDIAYVPNIKIIHHGGFAARKGIKHIWLFFNSMTLFFKIHHWRWF
ncbi:glycosyltransferase [Atlantibacter subterraneus]|uniref:glycosyltransferase n=1 Tax=Atlantibacter subterraneus TaxID=255519 RepID=UPI00289C9073|nr:glycosyltransferase [Atlantibacter subterranea]